MAINNTGKSLAGKSLSTMTIGCMRWSGPENVGDIIQECVNHGALYLDTSPMYCYNSETENSETWVGRGIKGIRDKVILSAKCSPGNGGMGIDEWDPLRGFSNQTADQVRSTIDQSLTRLGVDYFDCYQLWTVSNELVYESAFKKGGWLEGVMKAKDEGLFKHLGITGHPESPMIKRWADEGIFEIMTVPFHIMNTSRLEGIEYALAKGIIVNAMNPLNAGMLGNNTELEIPGLDKIGLSLENATELALKFVEAFGMTALCGVSTLEQAKSDIKYLSKPKWTREQALQVSDLFNNLFSGFENACTQCGYCKPCPVELDFPEMFKMKNFYKILKMDSAKQQLITMSKWYGDGYKLERCEKCGICETRCPNGLNVMEQIDETLEIIRG